MSRNNLKSWFHWIPVAFVVAMVAAVWWNFSFVYTDLDQTMLWTAAKLMSMGEWHGLRFYGQDYGTVIEALIAAGIPSEKWHITLPLVATMLWLLPFVIIAFSQSRQKHSLPMAFGVLALFPVEYFFIGTMPRDFLPGIAITSLALPLIRKNGGWPLIAVGALSLLGWYVNQSAALLGAFISVLAVFKGNKFMLKRAVAVAGGYIVVALLILIFHLFWNADQVVVHRGWDFHFAFKQWKDAALNLDRHYQWITPALYGQGWALPLMLIGLALIHRMCVARADVLALAVVIVLMVFSWGVLKIHDGRDSVFFSHERMFLALPVILVLAVVRLRPGFGPVLIVVILALVQLASNFYRLPHAIEYQVSKDRDHVVKVMTVNSFKNAVNELQELADSNKVNWVLAGPTNDQFGLMLSTGVKSLHPHLSVVNPGYERKYWEMQALDTLRCDRFIWITDRSIRPKILRAHNAQWKKTLVDGNPAYLIVGNSMDPLGIYRDHNLETSAF